MNYICCNENRKSAVLLNSTTLNGIDYLEVLDHEAIPLGSPRQRHSPALICIEHDGCPRHTGAAELFRIHRQRRQFLIVNTASL